MSNQTERAESSEDYVGEGLPLGFPGPQSPPSRRQNIKVTLPTHEAGPERPAPVIDVAIRTSGYDTDVDISVQNGDRLTGDEYSAVTSLISQIL